VAKMVVNLLCGRVERRRRGKRDKLS